MNAATGIQPSTNIARRTLPRRDRGGSKEKGGPSCAIRLVEPEAPARPSGDDDDDEEDGCPAPDCEAGVGESEEVEVEEHRSKAGWMGRSVLHKAGKHRTDGAAHRTAAAAVSILLQIKERWWLRRAKKQPPPTLKMKCRREENAGCGGSFRPASHLACASRVFIYPAYVAHTHTHENTVMNTIAIRERVSRVLRSS